MCNAVDTLVLTEVDNLVAGEAGRGVWAVKR
jgi:hypothetical protein